jgi:ferric-dicitrate binding protein FerR (iron transport regulator)
MKELFKKYIDGELTRSEIVELKAWIASSSENRELFKQFIALYKTGLQVTASGRVRSDEAWTRVNSRLAVRRLNRRWIRWSVAAGFALLLAAGSMIYMFAPAKQTQSGTQPELALTEQYPNTAVRKAALTLSNGHTVYLQEGQDVSIEEKDGVKVGRNSSERLVYENVKGTATEPLYNLISVPEGSDYSLTLADGTQVWLNGGSTLLYPLSMSGERIVSMTGEACFDVASKAGLPFIVQCGATTVRVTGTKFNVNAADTSLIAITLERGAVEVVSAQGVVAQMKPGEQLIAAVGKPFERRNVNALIYTSWTTGTFEFLQTPVGDILDQLTLWYGEEFVYASPELRNITFTGAVLKDKSLGYALLMLQKVSGLRFEKRERSTLVDKR